MSNIQNKIAQLKKNLANLSDQDARYRWIIDQGKKAPPLSSEEKDAKFLLSGCMSQAWLVPNYRGGKLYFSTDSDASIVKGILASLSEIYSGETPGDILKVDADALTDAGLIDQLSMNRRNGISSALKQMKLYATAYQMTMPDIAQEGKPFAGKNLENVGMKKIEVPIVWNDALLPASVDAFVSLDDVSAKGIHMSRLFLLVSEILPRQRLNPQTVSHLLQGFLSSHEQLSRGARVRVETEIPLLRPALISQTRGWRFYPFTLEASLKQNQKASFKLQIKLQYSSTCPCSAALARQLIQEKFRADFVGTESISKQDMEAWLGKESSILATPHGQRSQALIELQPKGDSWELESWIDLFEKALGTPVQTAVKRVDEQEFARLNGQNLMFAEDAARKLHKAIDESSLFSAWTVEVEHYESLHPHDAVAQLTHGEFH